jgi:hypothetical protein
MPIQKTSKTENATFATPAVATPEMNEGSTDPKPKGKRGPRGPRGETLSWDKPRIQALIRTLRKMESANSVITPLRVASALTELPEFSAQRHLLEDSAGALRVANKVKELHAARQAAIDEGRTPPSLPQFSTARGPRLDLAGILDEMGDEGEAE